MNQFESNQTGSSSDSSSNKQKEQKILMTLSFLTLKNIVFPKILNHLFFSEQKGKIKIRKTDQLLKLLTKAYNVDLIEKFTIDVPEYTELELIIKILQLCLENLGSLTEEILNSKAFYAFYYKLYDFQKKKQSNNVNNNIIFEQVQQIIQQTPNIYVITEDFKYFIQFKAQMIAIMQALKIGIPLTSLLLCTRFYMNRDTQQFFIEFLITNEVQLSNFNYLMNIDQLINQSTLSLSDMNYYVEKIFPRYEDELVETNFNIFQRNLDLILEQKKYLMIDLQHLVESNKFIEVYSQLAKYRHQVDQAELFYQGLSQIIQYCQTTEKSILDFRPVNIPSFIKKNFFRTHEKKELIQQHQIESLLIFNKIMTEMITLRFPFPIIITYLDFNNENILISISKELIIQCQQDKVFNLFLALVHYNFQTLAKSQTYSKAFYHSQIAKQDMQIKEIILKMLEIILEFQNLIKSDLEKILNEEDTKCKIDNFITQFQKTKTDQNSFDQKIASILLELIQFDQAKVVDMSNEIQLKQQLQSIISEIEYKTTKQPYQQRRLGRPPGFYQHQQYVQKRVKQQAQYQQKLIQQPMDQYQISKHKKINKLTSEQQLMEELESILV
ncbi:unnamed protein product [Paramecium octaurelia]|uniref:Uncharacterized protein n=1 Tax=Paramecium octaurelia TaxID=43137 RepID=A0A8S1XRY4_PAROT|nr:unnamed protein product [Paramecium octaurelia]